MITAIKSSIMARAVRNTLSVSGNFLPKTAKTPSAKAISVAAGIALLAVIV
jgi:hypothetical protein